LNLPFRHLLSSRLLIQRNFGFTTNLNPPPALSRFYHTNHTNYSLYSITLRYKRFGIDSHLFIHHLRATLSTYPATSAHTFRAPRRTKTNTSSRLLSRLPRSQTQPTSARKRILATRYHRRIKPPVHSLRATLLPRAAQRHNSLHLSLPQSK
jgi:hypothetical protein